MIKGVIFEVDLATAHSCDGPNRPVKIIIARNYFAEKNIKQSHA